MPLLRSASCWAAGPPAVAGVAVGVQAVDVRFALPGHDGPPLRLTFEHAGGAITARVADLGWAADLSPGQQAVLGAGLGGLAELFAATWETGRATVEAVPALAAELCPRRWEDRTRFWDTCGLGGERPPGDCR